jgi:hypothetical protein
MTNMRHIIAGAIITIIGPFIQWIHDNLVLPAKMGRKVAL